MNGRILRVLRPWEEVMGVLNNLSTNDGKLILSISLSINLEIPDQSVNKKMLEKVLGHHVGILRTDSGYLIRVFKTPNVDYIAHDEGQESKHSSSTKEKNKEGSFETIRAVGPDLKQSKKTKRKQGKCNKAKSGFVAKSLFFAVSEGCCIFWTCGFVAFLFCGLSVRSRLFQKLYLGRLGG